MSTTQVIGLIVGIIIVLVVIALIVQMGRKKKGEANRAKATELREEGDRTKLKANEQEANAASADAKAKQARVEAEKLQRQAEARAHDAQETRGRAQEHHQKAAELDPDGHGRSERNGRPDDNAQHEVVERDVRSSREGNPADDPRS